MVKRKNISGICQILQKNTFATQPLPPHAKTNISCLWHFIQFFLSFLPIFHPQGDEEILIPVGI
jgi:hypothetical protein